MVRSGFRKGGTAAARSTRREVVVPHPEVLDDTGGHTLGTLVEELNVVRSQRTP